MNVRVVLLASLLAVSGLVAVASPAAAMCYYDPADPLSGVECGVRSTINCIRSVIKDGACPV